MSFTETCAQARKASRALAIATTDEKNAALEAVATALVGSAARIASENEADVAAARTRGTKDALVDRLMLDASRVAGVAKSVREIAAAPDPIGQLIEERTVRTAYACAACASRSASSR